MVVLTGGVPAGSVPEEAVRLATELCPGGSVLVLEEGDDVETGVPQAGRYGLLTHIDDCWQEPFSRVVAIRENGRRIFVATLAYGGPVVVVAPDEPWLDGRLRLVLGVEAEEDAGG